jgi:Phage integrase, N-terminal SAM-like domain
MDDSDVRGRVGAFVVRRVFLPEFSCESFMVIGPGLRPVAVVDEYLAWLTDCERSPNTVGYARDLRAFWTFLAGHGLSWEQVGVGELAEFAAWARRMSGPRHRETVLFTAPRASSSAIPAPQTESESDGRRADDRARASAIEADIHSLYPSSIARRFPSHGSAREPRLCTSPDRTLRGHTHRPSIGPEAHDSKLRRRNTSCRSYPPTAFASTVQFTSSFTCQRQQSPVLAARLHHRVNLKPVMRNSA